MNDPNTEEEWKIFRRDLAGLIKSAHPDYAPVLEKQAELFLQEQLKAALAISQRSINLAAVLGAAIAVLAGSTSALIAKDITIWPHVISVGALLTLLVVSLCIAVHSARSSTFCYAGSNPKHWRSDLGNPAKPFMESRAEQIAFYSQNITENKRSLESTSQSLHLSLMLATAGLVAFSLLEFIFVLSAIAKNGVPAIF
jgi:hypothetical protein